MQVDRVWLRKNAPLRLEPLDEGQMESTSSFLGMVGGAPPMKELYALLQRLAPTDLSLLIQGETGTGKERVARAIHGASRRADRPFVVIDCTAIPPSLAPSRLFGHEKGAFTGATERSVGLFEAAQGGVLFLDEVGDLPMEIQPLLLRVLQEREVVPVGSSRPRPIDVRVLSASWRDLRQLVARGAFREDLYYRLVQAPVFVPPLRERREDLGMLCRHFLTTRPAHAPGARRISEEALAALSARPFAGNVRELQSTIERLACLAMGAEISVVDLELDRVLSRSAGQGEFTGGRGDGPAVPIAPFKAAKQLAIQAFERIYLGQLLQQSGPNVSRAATLAGVERHTLRELLRRYRLYSMDA